MPDQMTQNGRLLKLYTPLDFDVLLIDSFSGSEEISKPFRIDLTLVADVQAGMHERVDPDRLVGKAMAIEIQLSPGKKRFLNGVVRSFTTAGRDDRLAYYHAELVPWFFLFGLKSDCRIFQRQTVPDIIATLIEELGYKPYFRSDLRREYTEWDYCVQYRETDFNFLSRLMEEEGIAYHFEHKDDRTHIMVLTDSKTDVADCPEQSSFRFEPNAGVGEFEDVVLSFDARQAIGSSKWVERDYHMEMPRNLLEVSESSLFLQPENGLLEVFDYPGDYSKKFNKTGDRLDKVLPEGEKLVRLRIMKDEENHIVHSGASTARAFTTGFRFSLTQEPRSTDGPYLLTSLQHTARQAPAYITERSTGGRAYSNTFLCIPSAVPFVPPRSSPKPIIPGLQTARVIDENETPQEEIWPDKHGRVLVRFQWDRKAKFACWIRVAQPWAGNGWGHQWIPRIDDEVVVAFLEGDPDRPLIVGSVYNSDNVPPFPLPDHKTQSGIKTRSSPHGSTENFNLLRFEDKKGHECLELHAERTMIEGVEGSQFISVGGDRHITVGGTSKSGDKHGDVKEKIFKNRNLHVLTDDRERIEGDQSITVDGDSSAHYGGNRSAEVVGDDLVIAKTITLQAKQTITIVAGASSIVIGPSGITILGVPMLQLNPLGAVPPTPALMPGIDPPDDP